MVVIAFALLNYESDLLWKVQQYNLFLDTSIFFHDRMLVAGGFLSKDHGVGSCDHFTR